MSSYVLKTSFTAFDGVSPVLKRISNSFDNMFRSMDNGLNKFKNGFSTIGLLFGNLPSKIGKMFSGLNSTMGMLGLGGALWGIKTVIGKIVGEAQRVENLKASFMPLFQGDGAKTNKMIGMLNKEALRTPFTFQQISEAALGIMPTMKGNMEQTIKYTKMIGDMARGNSGFFSSIAMGFTRVLNKGKADMESLNMFREGGRYAIVQDIEAANNLMPGEAYTLSEKSMLTPAMVIKGMEYATSQGGNAYKGMEYGSKTLTGKLSALYDYINLSAALIGQNLIKPLGEYVEQIITVVSAIGDWAMANKEIINEKLTNFLKGVWMTLKIVYFFAKMVWWIFDKIGFMIPWIIGFYVAYRLVMIGTAIVQGVIAFWLAIHAVLYNKSAASLGKNSMALSIYNGLLNWQYVWLVISGTAMAAYNWITNLLTGSTGRATVAMNLFNLTNPVGWLIIATTAVTGLIFAMRGFSPDGEAKGWTSFMESWNNQWEIFGLKIYQGLMWLGKFINLASTIPFIGVLFSGKDGGSEWIDNQYSIAKERSNALIDYEDKKGFFADERKPSLKNNEGFVKETTNNNNNNSTLEVKLAEELMGRMSSDSIGVSVSRTTNYMKR